MERHTDAAVHAVPSFVTFASVLENHGRGVEDISSNARSIFAGRLAFGVATLFSLPSREARASLGRSAVSVQTALTADSYER
jgi:hypothetical protein